MANNDFPWDEFLPNDWTGFESDMWVDTFAPFEGTFYDAHAQALFDAGFFHTNQYSSDEIASIQEQFYQYLHDQYGIDFDDVFDWNEYRENYSEA